MGPGAGNGEPLLWRKLNWPGGDGHGVREGVVGRTRLEGRAQGRLLAPGDFGGSTMGRAKNMGPFFLPKVPQLARA